MGIEQTPDQANAVEMRAECPHVFIAGAKQSMLTDRAQIPDALSDLDAKLRAHHEGLPRATPQKVDLEVAHGKRQAVLGCLTEFALHDILEQAVPVLENRNSLVAASLPGPGLLIPDNPSSNHTPILRTVAGSSKTFLLSTVGWLAAGSKRFLSQAENPDDKNHSLWKACQAVHEEFGQASEARKKGPVPELRTSLRLTDQATAITTGQLLIARAVSHSRSRTIHPTGPELARSALQATDQLSWMIGGKFNLTFKYLHKVNWLGKFSAFEAADQTAAPELFTETPDLFDIDAPIQWRLQALREGPLPPAERGRCPLDITDEKVPQAEAPQIVEDFIGLAEDIYDVKIPRGDDGVLPGSTTYVTFATLLGAETIYAAWQAAMQRNAMLRRSIT